MGIPNIIIIIIKKLKYKSLCIDIQRMWNLKCTIVPVIIGATVIVTRSLKKNLKTIPGKHSIDSPQQTAILGTSHIIRKVLQCEAWSLSGGDHRWFTEVPGRNACDRRHTYRIIIIIIKLPFWPTSWVLEAFYLYLANAVGYQWQDKMRMKRPVFTCLYNEDTQQY